MRHPILLALVLLVACGAAVVWLEARPIKHPPGVTAPEPPLQQALADAVPIRHRGYRLTPVATFETEARVLGTQSYKGTPTGTLAPYDIAIGWGPMSDSAVLDELQIVQAQRAYAWGPAPHPLDPWTIVEHSTNIHVVPATAGVANAIAGLRPGHLVRLRGRLVDALGPDGDWWRTSRTRTDAGYGACEILWAEAVEVL